MKNRRIALGFFVIILLLGTVGAISLLNVRNVADNADMLYRHPFAVNNAVKNIQINLVSMHRSMKDVVLAENRTQLDAAIEKVNGYEQTVFTEFNVIFERFLGERQVIDLAYKAFVEWKVIRNTVIALVGKGKIQEAAAITKGEGADHVELLNRATEALADFAHTKAEEFHSEASSSRDHSLVIVSTLAVLTMAISIAIAVTVTRGLETKTKENRQNAHLIDQNIMMATFDIEGNVTSASNALCRFLGVTRENILGKPGHFFIVDDKDGENLISEIWRRIKTGQDWEGEITRQAPNGMTYWAASKVLPVLDENFEIVSYSNILQDTTSKKLSVTDNLTSLYNRRLFEETVDQELKIARRQESEVTLAIIDIDFFKKYNDRYGHPQGDVALSTVGATLQKCLKRPNDYAFRIGGEEFAVLFTGVNKSSSRHFLEGIRQSVEALNIPHEASGVADVLTISIGAACVSASTAPNQEELYAQADKALYLAKNTRNALVIS